MRSNESFHELLNESVISYESGERYASSRTLSWIMFLYMLDICPVLWHDRCTKKRRTTQD